MKRLQAPSPMTTKGPRSLPARFFFGFMSHSWHALRESLVRGYQGSRSPGPTQAGNGVRASTLEFQQPRPAR